MMRICEHTPNFFAKVEIENETSLTPNETRFLLDPAPYKGIQGIRISSVGVAMQTQKNYKVNLKQEPSIEK